MNVSTADLENPVISTVVGPRFETYDSRWRRLLAKRGALKSPWISPVSWNWAAFLFGIWWLFYRRMYGYGVALALLWLTFLGIAAADPKQLTAFYLMSGGINVALGRSANAMYLFYVVRRARKLAAMGHEELAGKRQVKSTSWAAVAICLLAQFFVSAVVFPVANSEPTSHHAFGIEKGAPDIDQVEGYRRVNYLDLKLDIKNLVGKKVEVFSRASVIGDRVLLLDPHKKFDTNPISAKINDLSRDDRRVLFSRCERGCVLTFQGTVRSEGAFGEFLQLHKILQ
jgi:hypothetical protein